MSVVIENQAKLHRWVVRYIVRKLVQQLGIEKYVISGSYRRGNWWCNDIDLLIPTSGAEENIGIDRLLRKMGWRLRPGRNFHPDIFSRQYIKVLGGKTVVMDVFLAPPGIWGNALLFTTGPKSFNDMIRAKLIKMGYSWSNPRYFTHIETNQPMSFMTERSALAFLDLKWIKPRNRI